jgi:hypothetical protein
VPRPCPAYGLRLTRPEIIHGSTLTSNRTRRVIYTWLTAILPGSRPSSPTMSHSRIQVL